MKKIIYGLLAGLAFNLSSCNPGGEAFTGCLKDEVCTVRLPAAKFSGDIPLSPQSGFWNSGQGPKKVTIELGPQLITNPQWPNPSIKQVTVSAARTDKEIALRLEWSDDTANYGQDTTRLYTDQAAILFPVDRSKEVPPITMGAEGDVVNIWIWKGARDIGVFRAENPESSEPSEIFKSPIEDLNAEGFSTLTSQTEQNVQGQGFRSEAGWQVVYKRNLTNSDENDAQFTGSSPMAIAIWDGGNRETNGQKGISPWIFLDFS